MAAAELVHLPSSSISEDTLPKTAQENCLDSNTIEDAVAHTQASHNKTAKDSHYYSVSLPKAIKDRHDELADESAHDFADERVQCVNMCKISFHLDDQLHGENEVAMLYGPLVSGADQEPPWEEPPEEAHEPADAQVVPLFDPILQLLDALPTPTKAMILPRLVE